MALTICPDCKNKISSRSEHCIFCGCPAFFYRDGETCQPDRDDQEFPKFLTIKETATETGISVYALRGMVKRNEIAFFQSGSRVYINLSKLQEKLSGE